MGFSDIASRAALRNYANDLGFALDGLLRGEFNNLASEPAPVNPVETAEPVVKAEVI